MSISHEYGWNILIQQDAAATTEPCPLAVSEGIKARQGAHAQISRWVHQYEIARSCVRASAFTFSHFNNVGCRGTVLQWCSASF